MAETKLEGVIELSADTKKAERDVKRMSDKAGGLVGGSFSGGLSRGLGATSKAAIGAVALGAAMVAAQKGILGFARSLGESSGAVSARMSIFDLRMSLLNRRLGDKLAPTISAFNDSLVGMRSRLQGAIETSSDAIIKFATKFNNTLNNALDVIQGRVSEGEIEDFRKETEGQSFFEKLNSLFVKVTSSMDELRGVTDRQNLLKSQEEGFNNFIEMIKQQREDDMNNERRQREEANRNPGPFGMIGIGGR